MSRDWMHEFETGYDLRNDQPLSESEADSFRRAAVDRNSSCPVVRHDNTHLTNSELSSRIQARIAEGKPIGGLMDEYQGRGFKG